MALARARRERTVEYWPGFVDALSTLVLGIVFLLSTFVVVQFYLSQEVTGKDTALARLRRCPVDPGAWHRISALHLCRRAVLFVAGSDRQGHRAGAAQRPNRRADAAPVHGEDRQGEPRGDAYDVARGLGQRRRRTRSPQGTIRGPWVERGRRPGQGNGAGRPTRRPETNLGARDGPGRTAQPTGRRLTAPTRGARGRARGLGKEGQRGAGAHCRSRPAAQRRSRPAGAGIVTLSFGVLRPAARYSGQPAGHPGGRRPLRVPVGSAV